MGSCLGSANARRSNTATLAHTWIPSRSGKPAPSPTHSARPGGAPRSAGPGGGAAGRAHRDPMAAARVADRPGPAPHELRRLHRVFVFRSLHPHFLPIPHIRPTPLIRHGAGPAEARIGLRKAPAADERRRAAPAGEDRGAGAPPRSANVRRPTTRKTARSTGERAALNRVITGANRVQMAFNRKLAVSKTDRPGKPRHRRATRQGTHFRAVVSTQAVAKYSSGNRRLTGGGGEIYPPGGLYKRRGYET